MKKFLSFVLCIVLLSVFVGCGNKSENAFNKLKNIIIENGTEEEEDYSFKNKFYEFEYQDGSIKYSVYNPNTKLEFESFSYSKNYKMDNDTIYCTLFFDKSNQFNASFFSYKHGNCITSYMEIKDYRPGTEIKLDAEHNDLEDDYYDNKEIGQYIYKTACNFASALASLNIDIRDIGFNFIVDTSLVGD